MTYVMKYPLLQLSIYKFDENPFDIGYYSGIDKPFEDIYTPDILKVIFIQCTENLCIIEKNEKAKFFFTKTMQQLRLKTLDLPANTVNILSSPNSTCIVAFTNEGLLNSKAHICFVINFEESEFEASAQKDCKQALSYKENFEKYVIDMIDRVKISTKKPSTILSQFKTNVKHYQDLFDSHIISQHASKFLLGEWIIKNIIKMIMIIQKKLATKYYLVGMRKSSNIMAIERSKQYPQWVNRAAENHI
ncbi:hypothetical protein C2G38_2032140 [Gigaspora rosea]|uniref:Uncharacterized protein n=1 Tax=Gigaspora rosea TaxID=44941 RepID=A0A397VYN6_9GLOM|nr:hypothetical protein C2G38_2032140 [Gigaspora rosea]